MKSPKTKPHFPTTTQLRSKDPQVLRAELDLFRQKSITLATQEPAKAAFILSEWLGKPARRVSAGKKSAA